MFLIVTYVASLAWYICAFSWLKASGNVKWSHNFPLSVLILSSLAQKQKKKQIFFPPLSIIFLILSWKPKKNMFWLYLQIYLIILECWTTFYLWKRPLIECLWAWSLLACRDFLCGTPGTKREPGQRCQPAGMAAPPGASMHSGLSDIRTFVYLTTDMIWKPRQLEPPSNSYDCCEFLSPTPSILLCHQSHLSKSQIWSCHFPS